MGYKEVTVAALGVAAETQEQLVSHYFTLQLHRYFCPGIQQTTHTGLRARTHQHQSTGYDCEGSEKLWPLTIYVHNRVLTTEHITTQNQGDHMFQQQLLGITKLHKLMGHGPVQ